MQGLFQLSETRSFPKGLQVQKKRFFELEKSTPTGRRADRTTTIGPPIQTLNSVVDHRSVFLKLTVFGKTIEAVCDSGASVSCLSSVVFDKLQELDKLKLLRTATKFVAANKLPITSRGTVRLPITIGPKHYQHEFHVLIDSEADCLVGLDFLRTNKCDPLFSKDLLPLDSKNHVPLYNRKLNHEVNTVFRVIATETVSVPAGHAMILPARIQEGQRPLTELPALIEPVARISTLKNAVVPSVLFNFAEENVTVTIENIEDEAIAVYENTALGTSEFFPKQALNHIVSAPPKPKTNEVDESYELKHVIDSISPAITIKMRHKFAELVQEFADVFFRKINGTSASAMPQLIRLMFTRVQSPSNYRKKLPHYEHPDQRKNSWNCDFNF